jgi:type I restriction enzyme S subunit
MSFPTIELRSLMRDGAVSINPANFSDEKFNLYSIPAFDTGEPEVLPGAAIGSTKQVVQPGDILLSKIVPHIRRAWIVGSDSGRRTLASSEWIVFRSEKVEPRYLRHVLMSDQFHAEFMQTIAGVGGSLLRARPSYVADIRIPFPSYNKQRRIADILDKADGLRAKRRATLAQLDALAQSIFADMFGDPATNPKGWIVSVLAKLAKQITDGEHITPRRDTKGIKLLSARNVRDGSLDLENVDYIDEAEYARISRRCAPTLGDVLISCSGTIRGGRGNSDSRISGFSA